MITLFEAYNKANDRQEQYLQVIQNNPNHNIKAIATRLAAESISKFLFYFFEENNVVKAKQSLYTVQKLKEFSWNLVPGKYYPSQVNSLIFLCSDNVEIIDNFKNIKIESLKELNYKLERGHTLGFAIQQILRSDFEKALEYIEIYESNYRDHDLKALDSKILRALIHKDENQLKELIEEYVLPKNHNKSSEKGMLSFNYISYDATVYAKLAWILGMEIVIDSPLVPQELLPIQPNESYHIEFDFLENYEKPKPKVKDTPKRNGFFGNLFGK